MALARSSDKLAPELGSTDAHAAPCFQHRQHDTGEPVLIGKIAELLYAKQDIWLRPAAQRNVIAHLLKLAGGRFRDAGRGGVAVQIKPKASRFLQVTLSRISSTTHTINEGMCGLM